MSPTAVEAGTEFLSLEMSDEPGASDYLVVIERSERGWGAYVPDLPGLIAAADRQDEVRRLIDEAITFHLDGLREEGEIIPPPTSRPSRIVR